MKSITYNSVERHLYIQTDSVTLNLCLSKLDEIRTIQDCAQISTETSYNFTEISDSEFSFDNSYIQLDVFSQPCQNCLDNKTEYPSQKSFVCKPDNFLSEKTLPKLPDSIYNKKLPNIADIIVQQTESPLPFQSNVFPDKLYSNPTIPNVNENENSNDDFIILVEENPFENSETTIALQGCGETIFTNDDN